MTTAERPRAGSIVVGFDGSRGAVSAVEWAVEQALVEHRALTLLYSGGQSVLRSTGLLGVDVLDQADLLERIRRSDIALLERAATNLTALHPDLDVEVLLVDTDPRTSLVAASDRAHVVVVGSRGHGPVMSVLLGSVGRFVAEHGRCPVVVVREPVLGTRRGVVVGVDWTTASVPVAEFAFRQASLRGVPVTVMHALWNVPSALAERPLTQVDDQRGLGLLLAETIAGLREKYPDVPVLFELRRGLADDCLAQAAPRAELVVVGRPPHDLISRVMDGSTAISLVEHARGVVAVVPEAPFAELER